MRHKIVTKTWSRYLIEAKEKKKKEKNKTKSKTKVKVKMIKKLYA